MNDTLIIIFTALVLIALIAMGTMIFVFFRLSKSYKILKELNAQITEERNQLRIANIELTKKHQLSPSYETQLMMAELLTGNSLFRIERIDTEDLLLRRR